MVVKFADTQKEKEQKKVQQIQTNLWSLASVDNGLSSGFAPFGRSQFQFSNGIEGKHTVLECLNSINCSPSTGLIGSPLTVGAPPQNDYNLIALQQHLLSLQHQQQLLGIINLLQNIPNSMHVFQEHLAFLIIIYLWDLANTFYPCKEHQLDL